MLESKDMEKIPVYLSYKSGLAVFLRVISLFSINTVYHSHLPCQYRVKLVVSLKFNFHTINRLKLVKVAVDHRLLLKFPLLYRSFFLSFLLKGNAPLKNNTSIFQPIYENIHNNICTLGTSKKTSSKCRLILRNFQCT